MIQSGANLDAALAEADRLGVEHDCVRRTGEIRFRFPDGGRPITVNRRRKDAPRQLTNRLRKLARAEDSCPD